MKPTIKITTQEARRAGINVAADLIEVSLLTRYGFDDKLVRGFVEYEIFPQTYLHCGRVMVLREDIRVLVNNLLTGALTLYQTTEEAERIESAVAAEAEANKVTLTPDDLKALEQDPSQYLDMLVTKVAEKQQTTKEAVQATL